jgi:hypothetical protein
MRETDDHAGRDPVDMVRLGAKKIYLDLCNKVKSDGQVHFGSLFCSIGSLAGYACQSGLRELAIAKGLPPAEPFQVVETKDGTRYFFGDHINYALVESQYSVWNLAAGAAQNAGCQDFPDLAEIFKHTSSAIGTDRFGIPRFPAGYDARDTPESYLKSFWPQLVPTVRQYSPDPELWRVLFGLVVQEAIAATASLVQPYVILKIVMEAAIPMSKIDLDSLKL